MSALINTKKSSRHFFLILFGFITKDSSAEKSEEKLTEKSAEKSIKKSAKKSVKKQRKQKHRLKECGTDNDPCIRVNELSAPCNQTLPPPTSKVSMYEVTSYGNGALCNCNRLYYETLQSCTCCMENNSSYKVSIQPLRDWRESCKKFGTRFTDFPPFEVTPYSQLEGGNSTTNTTKIVPLSDSNNVAFDILLSICVIETVLIIAGVVFYIFFRKCFFGSKKLNESNTKKLQNEDILNILNSNNQLENQLLFQKFLQFLQSQKQTNSQNETIPI
ncbi:hypothetical protein C2G38_2041380 [Gigaspora rosea]|uniref:Uncharacterized protein n=1 Tax=Gigaspora rosea TaxID=44941 RepID=A0A397UZE7_9GLOM|nr:hypothetical protein C2G38_2041380 [Gigaspora rosea]CAG8760218.1 6573_t:CDS:2 [Gigaspora rosea]